MYGMPFPEAVKRIATKDIGGYSVVWTYTEAIPDERRVRRNNRGNLTETVLVLQKMS